MKCPNCKLKIDDNETYCKYCGMPVMGNGSSEEWLNNVPKDSDLWDTAPGIDSGSQYVNLDTFSGTTKQTEPLKQWDMSQYYQDYSGFQSHPYYTEKKKRRWLILPAAGGICVAFVLVVICIFMFNHNSNDGINLADGHDKKQNESESKGFETYYEDVSESDIVFQNDINEDDYNTYLEFEDTILSIETTYLNDNGYVESSNISALLDEMEQIVQQGVSDGVISHYNREEDNIFIKFSSGIPYLFIPYEEGMLSSGNGGQIITLEPNEDDYSVNYSYVIAKATTLVCGIEYEGALRPSSNASLIVEKVPDLYTYDYRLKLPYDVVDPLLGAGSSLRNLNVTVECLKTLADNKIIIWEGHGAYNEEIHSALITGEHFIGWKELSKYKSDLKDDVIVLTSFPSIGDTGIRYSPVRYYGITSKFVEKYIGEMNESLVFLGACSSLQDDVLAQSFLDKGASIVLGYTQKTTMYYEMISRTVFFNNLVQKNDSGYQTVENAYQSTMNIVGIENNGCRLSYYISQEGVGSRYTLNGMNQENVSNELYEEFVNAAVGKYYYFYADTQGRGTVYYTLNQSGEITLGDESDALADTGKIDEVKRIGEYRYSVKLLFDSEAADSTTAEPVIFYLKGCPMSELPDSLIQMLNAVNAFGGDTPENLPFTVEHAASDIEGFCLPKAEFDRLVRVHSIISQKQENGFYRYLLYTWYDINHDGSDELLAEHVTCEADRTLDVYTFDHDELELLGSISMWHGAVYEENGSIFISTSMGYDFGCSYRQIFYDGIAFYEIDAGKDVYGDSEGHSKRHSERNWLDFYSTADSSPVDQMWSSQDRGYLMY